VRIDRKRKKKGSNDDWTHPHDPDAKITKMKDGPTHLAHKAEHAIDLDTGAIVGVGVTVQGADEGDTTTIQDTLPEAAEQLEAVAAVTDDTVAVIEEVVADKGYHSRQTVHVSRRWRFAPTSANLIVDPSCGLVKRRNVTRFMRIAAASAATAGNGSSGNAGNYWSDPARTSMRPVASGALMCVDMRTCSSGCSFMPAPSIAGCGCARSAEWAPARPPGPASRARHGAQRPLDLYLRK